MNNFNFDKYLNIVNEEKKKYGLDLYAPLYPMFRMENGKLYVGVMLVNDDDNVWSKESKVKPEYWALIDIDTEKIVSFNKTEEKDFVVGEIIPKTYDNKEKEISKYTVEKTIQYRDYLKEDIKNFKAPLQVKLEELLGEEVEIDGEKINISDYVFANIEEEINDKLNKLVEMLIWTKYGSVVFYYDLLYRQVIEEHKKGNTDLDKIKLCAEIMNNYYAGVTYIDNFFNV
ncbi:MAG: hypothetical protein IJ134_04435 [Bacilli bacterium]|nr:hypothetical protein [Bacilli bacterium]